MKIALIFSGIPRYLDISSSYFQTHLLNHYNVDVYSYTWKLESYNEIDNYYQCKAALVQQPIDFFNRFKETGHNIYSHWYGIQYACRSFKTYLDMNDLDYDFVIRTRHDIALHEKINFYNFDKELLYVANCHWPEHQLFDDNLMIVSLKNYFKIFNNIFDWYVNRHDINQFDDIPEMKLYEYLDHKGQIKNIRRNSNLDFTLSRSL